MTLSEAIAQQPAWVGIWLNILSFCALLLPLSLFIWRASRTAAIATLLANIASFVSITWLYNQLGYVKLLGLPHVIFWTPIVIFYISRMRRDDMPIWPRRIMAVVVTAMVISLAFDYVDTARYLLGETTPSIPPPTN